MSDGRDGGRPRFLGGPSLLLLGVALAVHSMPIPWAVNRFDAGIAPVAAMRLLAGEHPYVSFQTLYSPGWYYVVAAAFEVFGATFDVVTRLDTGVVAVTAWLAWHVAARLSGSRFVALLAFAGGLAFVYPYPSLALAFTALLAADRARRSGSPAVWIGCAVPAGLTAFFRQDVGLAAIAAVTAVAFAPDGGRPLRERARRAGVTAVCALLSAAIFFLPPLLVVPGRLWSGLVTNPAATVPFRSDEGGIAALGRMEWIYGATAALVAVQGVTGLVRMGRDGAASPLVPGAAVLALWSLRYLLLRPDPHHLIPAGILAGVLGATTMPRACFPRLAAFGLACAVIAVPLLRLNGARIAHALGLRDSNVVCIGDTVPGASTLHVLDLDAPDFLRVLQRLPEVVPEGRTFLSACKRHDRIATQDLLIQFLAKRPAVPYDWHFDPGVTTRDDVQRGIAADCDRAGIDVILRWEGASHRSAPPVPGASRFLDDWIERNFERSETFGRYEIWSRRR